MIDKMKDTIKSAGNNARQNLGANNSGFIHDLRMAAMLLTRIPVGGDSDGDADSTAADTASVADTSRSYWAFGLIGAGIAAIPAALGVVLLSFGAPGFVVAAMIAGALALLTGGIHHDGLADCADGLQGRDAAGRLAIMRDSRIGSFGTIALIVVIVTYIGTVAALANHPASGFYGMAAAVIAAAAMSRALMGVVRFLHEPPESDDKSLARATGRPDFSVVAGGIALALMLALVIGFAPFGAMAILIASGCGGVAALACGVAARRLLGGVNGDCLGASQQTGEAVMLVALFMLIT